MIVRAATMADIPALVSMGRQMHAESPRFAPMTFSADKCAALAEHLIGMGSVFVAETGAVVGMLAGAVVEHFFSEDRYACDLVVYVLPSHRGSTAFIRLVAAFEQWAVAQGVREIIMGVSTEVAPDRVIAMYERMGYDVQRGRTLIKRVS